MIASVRKIEQPAFVVTAFQRFLFIQGKFDGTSYRLDLPETVSIKIGTNWVQLKPEQLQSNLQVLEILKAAYDKQALTAQRDKYFDQKKRYGRSY